VTSEGASALKADFGEEVPPQAVAFDGRTGWEIRNEYAVMYQRETALASPASISPTALPCSVALARPELSVTRATGWATPFPPGQATGKLQSMPVVVAVWLRVRDPRRRGLLVAR